MSEYFLGQIMMTGFPFAPKYFAQCNGQILGVSQNQALFALLGFTYGGNGQTAFMLPNMQSRTPVGYGQSADAGWNPPPYPWGAIGGVETVTITPDAMPAHNHPVNATRTAGTTSLPTDPSLYGTAVNSGGGGNESIYVPIAAGTPVPLGPTTVSLAGAGAPHQNMQPYSVINFNIALSGIFPSRG
ncbi:MAG: phage tail protein [Brevundimonas sp.]